MIKLECTNLNCNLNGYCIIAGKVCPFLEAVSDTEGAE